ncbi:MAG: HAMP domain-containing histidine kinase [Sphingomonadales bacterium]|nr:HAMP domain-containing histidine kinase [Sphingomonadales bacterium]MBD3775266.1 HAMP domain-containing histidine kinase [Paracoccaceae bacterium]
MKRSLEENTATDIAGLVDIYASGGRAELLQRLNDRYEVENIDGRQAHYLLSGTGGTRISGDVPHWPSLNPAISERGFVKLPDGTPVYARSAHLDENLDLLVAREYSADRRAMLLTVAVFLLTGLVIVLGVIALARATSQRLSQRVEGINALFREPADARLESLATLPDRPDEIDELACHSAETLARQGRLLRMHKHMSDNVAHEIRTPLMHLDQKLVKALAAAADGGEATALGQARSDIRGIAGLLDSLLDIASNEARRGDRAGLETVDLSAMVEQIAELYEGSFEDAGLALTTEIAPGVSFAAEPMQVTRLISNLLDNAIKYVPRGGMVQLALQPGPRLIVSDNGPGVPPDRREAIFDRFVRADRGDASGHGLGLALARAIAERHGLALYLADSDDGATFVAEPM